MSDRNTVTVRIYGQEYSFSGEMSREYIMKLADYVDGKMKEVGAGKDSINMSAAAVLAAVNITDEYFELKDQVTGLEELNRKLEHDAQQYGKLWEEAQQSLARFKEQADNAAVQKDDMFRQYSGSQKELSDLNAQLAEARKHNEVLRNRVEELNEKLESNENAPAETQKLIKDLEMKCRDIESSFFDIQMENIHLKSELEALRRQR